MERSFSISLLLYYSYGVSSNSNIVLLPDGEGSLIIILLHVVGGASRTAIHADETVARTDDVGVDGAQFVTPAVVPADAHLVLHVLRNGHVAFVITMMADRNTFETSCSTLAESLTTECLFGGIASFHLQCVVSLVVGMAESDLTDADRFEVFLSVVFVFNWVDEEVDMGEFTIGVIRIAKGLNLRWIGGSSYD